MHSEACRFHRSTWVTAGKSLANYKIVGLDSHFDIVQTMLTWCLRKQ
jgi:hypothetical protein